MIKLKWYKCQSFHHCSYQPKHGNNYFLTWWFFKAAAYEILKYPIFPRKLKNLILDLLLKIITHCSKIKTRLLHLYTKILYIPIIHHNTTMKWIISVEHMHQQTISSENYDICWNHYTVIWFVAKCFQQNCKQNLCWKGLVGAQGCTLKSRAGIASSVLKHLVQMAGPYMLLKTLLLLSQLH